MNARAPGSDTQAILLLTAPLIVGQPRSRVSPLTPQEYKALARGLHASGNRPSDLLAGSPRELLAEAAPKLDVDRVERLLERGVLLSQALERWNARAIWVLSRADEGYPRRWRERLGLDAPAVVYGCGDPRLLDEGGLAVVGSRRIGDELSQEARAVGALAARAGVAIASGGAAGSDSAAMRGALDEGGSVVAVLGDSLERAALAREHREALLYEQLALVSPFDPAARFQVGHAMQRNKLIYASADAALVIACDKGRGGTWAGAIEQLRKLRFVPVYLRGSRGDSSGLDALENEGATRWPGPASPEELRHVVEETGPTNSSSAAVQGSLF